MKVAIVCDVLGKPNNGTTIAALNLISHLRSRGHEVRVVSPDAGTMGQPGSYVVPTADLGSFLNGVLEKNGVSLAKPDRSVISEALDGVDVVHLLFPFPLAWAAAKEAVRRGLPITASFHCQAENFTSHIGLMNSSAASKLVYRVFYRKVYRYCSFVHYPTEFIKNEFEESVGTSLPCRVISNGVNDVFFNEREGVRCSDKFTIVCMGRYSKEKAQHTVIEAIARSKYRDSIKLVLAGDGPLKRRLMRKAAKLNVDCDFKFFERDELAHMLRGADLYVHTSVAEIEAIACLESIVCGLVPVICNSPRSATRFFALDRLNLYKKGDVDELTARIEYFYEHPEEIRKYRELYKTTLHSYRQRDCMLAMERMLAEAAGCSVTSPAYAEDYEENDPLNAVVG